MPNSGEHHLQSISSLFRLPGRALNNTKISELPASGNGKSHHSARPEIFKILRCHGSEKEPDPIPHLMPIHNSVPNAARKTKFLLL